MMLGHLVFLVNLFAVAVNITAGVEPGMDSGLLAANVLFALYGLVLIAKD